MPERVSLTGQRDPNERAKNDAEDRWAAAFAAEFDQQYLELLDQLDPDNPQAPTGDWWQKWLAVLAAIAILELELGAQESALNAIGLSGVGVEWDAVLAESENWASTYGFNLVRGVTQNQQSFLQDNLTKFYAGDIDYDTLLERIGKRFSPVRASMIASTEVTRAYERGLDIYEDRLNGDGIQTDRIWWTMQDEDVCPVCEPNEGKLRSEGWTVPGLPAHPLDRCWTELVTILAERSGILVPNWPVKRMAVVTWK